MVDEDIPPVVSEMIGAYVESARLLGLRTAELHAALADADGVAAFAPEPFTPYYQRGLYQSMRNLTTNSFALLANRLREDENAPPEARAVFALENEVLNRFRSLTSQTLTSMRIRTHGDYHLGQLLYTGNDFMITDFEGEPSRTLAERRIKRMPLRDVAGMLRSFSYAVHTSLLEQVESGLSSDAVERARGWGRFWQAWVGSIFLRSYLQEAQRTALITAERRELELLLDVYILEKAVYEVAYELNNRPNWLIVPLQGILEILQVES
jgi:maltose alpha-D-glucosyltransferase/alpha-amylase